MDPHIAQIPESDKQKHCPCHKNTYEHKASAHQGDDVFGSFCPADMLADGHLVRVGNVEEVI